MPQAVIVGFIAACREAAHNAVKNLPLFRYACCIFTACLLSFPAKRMHAQEDVDSLKAVLNTSVHDTVKLQAIFDILSVLGPKNDSFGYFNEQIKLLADKNLSGKNIHPDLKRTCLAYKGEYYENKAVLLLEADIVLCMDLYDSAIKIYVSINDSVQVSHALVGKGICYQRIFQYDKAIGHCFEALKFYEHNGDQPNVVYVITMISKIYQSLEDYPKALSYLNRALKYYDTLTTPTIPNISQCIIINHDIGFAYFKMGRYEESENYFTKALIMAKTIRSNNYISILLGKMGRLQFKQKKYTKALSLYKDALKLAGTGVAKSNLFTNIGELYLEKKEYSRAIVSLEKGLTLAKSYHYLQTQENASKLLYQAYKQTSQFEKSLQMYELYTSIRDSAKIEESKNTLKEQQLKYDYEKKELLHKIANEKILAALKIDNERKSGRKNMLLYTFLSLVILLLTGILFLYKYFKQKNIINANKNNALKQRLLLTQMNPHFIFNSVDNIQSLIYNKQDKEAINYLTRFSKLTRQILENSRENYILLSEELSMLDNYLSIQKLLYNSNFTYSLTVDEKINPEAVLLPPMLTQPFIENAIKHGLKNKTEGGWIKMHFFMERDLLFFEVTDNGTGFAAKGNGQQRSLSTQITQERLDSLSSGQAISIRTFNVTDANGVVRGAKTSFEIPYVHNN